MPPNACTTKNARCSNAFKKAATLRSSWLCAWAAVMPTAMCAKPVCASCWSTTATGCCRLWSALLAQYVLEIAEHLATQPHRLLPNSYGRFAAENPEFVMTCKQQAASYWDCYHRHRYPLLRQHPGIPFLRWVDEARRSLPHAG